MAMTTANAQCSICNKQRNTYNCKGCSKDFCFKHLTKHRQILNQEFDKIENNHDELRQTIIDQKNDPKKRSLIQEIDKWEEDSIEKIKQTADECRQKLIKYLNISSIEMENKLNNFAIELKNIREENEFNEIDLNQLREKFKKLQELNKPTNISIEQKSTTFINKIFVNIPVGKDAKWKQAGLTIAGGNAQGNQLNQLDGPEGIFIDDDQTIYIADFGNDRIVEWKSNATNGRIAAGGFGQGNQTNQLNCPINMIIDKENDSFIIADYGNKRVVRWFRQNNINGEIVISDIKCGGLAMDKNGSLYVSDCEKNEVRRWKRGDKNGIRVAGGNGKGDNLNQLNFPTYIFVDKDYSLYISDMNNHRVMKWVKNAKEGIIVAGGNSQGNSCTQLSLPHAVIVDQFSQIYVADWGNHRVMRWCNGAEEGTIVVGGNGKGEESNQLNQPRGLSFDGEGNLCVVDGGNDRLQKFEIDFD